MEKEDYDFDFSKYEQEEMEDVLIKDKKPKVSYLKSRFSLGEKILDIIGDIRAEVSVLAAEVEGGTQDVNTIKKLYGRLNEIWALISHTQGTINTEGVNTLKKEYWGLLEEHKDKTIQRETHEKFLKYRNKIYRILASCNLSFEVEKVGGGSIARKVITET